MMGLGFQSRLNSIRVDSTTLLLIKSSNASIILFLPTAVLNAGMWGQADGFYTCLIVYSIYFMLKDKSKIAFSSSVIIFSSISCIIGFFRRANL